MALPRIDPAITRAIATALQPLAGETRQLAVDAFLPRAASLQSGDVALLRIEHSAGSSLLSLLAAVQEDEPFALGDEFAPYFSDASLPAVVVGHVERRRAEGNVIAVPARTIPLGELSGNVSWRLANKGDRQGCRPAAR